MNIPGIKEGQPHVYLKPGMIWIGNHSTVISTVLGSCVSMTCFNSKSGYAAICHALHPQCPKENECDEPCAYKYRYTTCAVEAIAQAMTNYMQHRADMEVKLFGGASLIARRSRKPPAHSIGRANVEAAMKAINRLKLPLKVSNVGGNYGRKIIFDTATGLVHLKRLSGNCGGENDHRNPEVLKGKANGC